MNDLLASQYAARFEAIAEYRRRAWALLVREYFGRWVPKDGAVLDLGCGWGEFINQVDAAQRWGMDLNPESRGKLAAGVVCLEQDCSQRWQLPDNSLDLVFTSNFFEHLPDKPALRRTLDQVVRCLRPGGRLVCLGPNIRFIPGRYWDFWDHYLPLTERSLAEGLLLAGLNTERVVARFLPYSMSQGFTPPLWLLRLYLRMPWVWRLVGRQFLVVARKPTR